jgi:proteasome lid subunit RPN8/RPN11
MNLLSQGIMISPEFWAQMEANVKDKEPEEACGLLAGIGNQVFRIIPVTNILHNSYAFRMDPQEELNAFYLAEKNGWDIIAIYHSHPNGLSKPSETDIAQLSFPGIVYLIWYKLADTWNCLAYLINSQDDIGEVPLIIKSK